MGEDRFGLRGVISIADMARSHGRYLNVALVVSYLFFLLCCAGPIALTVSSFVLSLVVVFLVARARLCMKGGAEFLLAFPIFVSALQNVPLVLMANQLSVTTLQLALTYVFAYELVLFVTGLFFAKSISSNALYTGVMLLVLLIIAALSLLAGRSTVSFASVIAALRNFVAPFLFLFAGLVFAKRASLKTLRRMIYVCAWIVILFGLYEAIIDRGVWTKLGISVLWPLKGIRVGYDGLPLNFHSSEYIGGMQVLRMSSTFADPVNLGAFLFFVFVVAFEDKRRILSILLLVCCVLTISKAALLGLLIYAVVKSLLYKRNRIIGIVAIVGALAAGVGFVLYSFSHSTNSLGLHLQGFFGSFAVLRTHPFGTGIGSSGTLSVTLLGDSYVSGGTSESGLGIIVVQLGLFGFLLYVFFFLCLFFWRRKVNMALYLTLLFAIVANIAFNEVALSPNSCGPYFLMMGFLLNSKAVFVVHRRGALNGNLRSASACVSSH